MAAQPGMYLSRYLHVARTAGVGYVVFPRFEHEQGPGGPDAWRIRFTLLPSLIVAWFGADTQNGTIRIAGTQKRQ